MLALHCTNGTCQTTAGGLLSPCHHDYDCELRYQCRALGPGSFCQYTRNPAPSCGEKGCRCSLVQDKCNDPLTCIKGTCETPPGELGNKCIHDYRLWRASNTSRTTSDPQHVNQRISIFLPSCCDFAWKYWDLNRLYELCMN